MKNVKLFAGALVVLISACSSSNGQHGCRHQRCGDHPSPSEKFHAGYHANVHWPKIYIPPARSAVCQTYNAMVNNGWRRQNLLGDYHFNKETHELTNAGKLKVNWILSQAPMQRRNVFVQRAGEEVSTTARIAAVHDYAGKMSPSVGEIDVNDTHIVAEGHPAASVDSVFVGYENNRLPPVLPASTGTGGGGTGSTP